MIAYKALSLLASEIEGVRALRWDVTGVHKTAGVCWSDVVQRRVQAEQ